MDSDRALKNWVDDQLYALVGYAEGSVSAYIVALGASLGQSYALCHESIVLSHSIAVAIFLIGLLK